MKPLRTYVSLGSLKQLFLRPSRWPRLPKFALDLIKYRRMEARVGRIAPLRLYPCLGDDTIKQPVAGFYFYQDCWAARQVFRERPPFVVDIGSTVLLAGILSQFVRCISVDIRPVESRLEGLQTVSGTVLALPFSNDQLPCLTSMCVLEHIGLGRYGDPLSATGTEDAVQEIRRVVAPQGIVVFSVPIGVRTVTEFNANRRFTYDEVRGFFPDWLVVDECLLVPYPVPYSQDWVKVAKDPVLCLCMRKQRPMPDNSE